MSSGPGDAPQRWGARNTKGKVGPFRQRVKPQLAWNGYASRVAPNCRPPSGACRPPLYCSVPCRRRAQRLRGVTATAQPCAPR
jgi:hypothetical protein